MRHATIVAGLLAAACSQPTFAVCTKDAFELDFNAATGAVLVGGTSQSRNFCDDSEDWMSIPVCPGRAYSLDTSTLGAAADTLIELYAGDGTTLLFVDDDAGPDPTGHLAWTETSARRGTLHARIRQRDGTHGDLRDYKIQLTGDTSPCSTDVMTIVPASGEFLEITSIVQSIDGGLVTAGTLSNFRNLAVTRWRNDGTISWTRTFGEGTTQTSYLARTADGGFVASGYFNLIAKITDSGVVDWQRRYGTSGHSVQSIAASRDGSVYAAGFWSPSTNNVDGWLLKLNALGAADWSILVGGADRDVFVDVQALPNGGAVAVGSTYIADNMVNGLLVEVNAASAIVRQLYFHAAAVETSFKAVHPLAAGGYLVGGSYCPAGIPCRALLLKLTAAGAIVWQRTVEWAGTEEDVWSIGTFHDGSIYARIVRLSGQLEPVNTRWSANGTLLWQSPLGAAGDFAGEGIVTDDGGIAAVYGGGIGASSNLRLVRTYSTGNKPSCISGSSTTAFPGLPTLTVSASSLGAVDLVEPAPSANFAIASSDRSAASMCCSRVLGPPILVAGKMNTAISWENDGFGPYDLVRGDLATLKATGGDFTAALDAIPSNQQCLAQGVSEPLVVDSYDQPLPGTGYFYLVRGGTGACPTLYDESAHQLGARDAEITAASGPCP